MPEYSYRKGLGTPWPPESPPRLSPVRSNLVAPHTRAVLGCPDSSTASVFPGWFPGYRKLSDYWVHAAVCSLDACYSHTTAILTQLNPTQAQAQAQTSTSTLAHLAHLAHSNWLKSFSPSKPTRPPPTAHRLPPTAYRPALPRSPAPTARAPTNFLPQSFPFPIVTLSLRWPIRIRRPPPSAHLLLRRCPVIIISRTLYSTPHSHSRQHPPNTNPRHQHNKTPTLYRNTPPSTFFILQQQFSSRIVSHKPGSFCAGPPSVSSRI